MNVTIDNKDFFIYMERLLDRLEVIENKIDKINQKKNVLDGEDLLDNADLATLLKVSERTLGRYRKKGILPYIMLSGRCYYRATDIHKLIRERF